MSTKIKRGDRVKDSVTGFTGFIVSSTEYLNGCHRCQVQSDVLKDGLPTAFQAFDEPQLDKCVDDYTIRPVAIQVTDIQVTDKVKHTITGFVGIVVARTHWLNGNVRFEVQSDVLKDGAPMDSQCFDAHELKLVLRAVVKSGPKDTGGPKPAAQRAADPRR